MIKIGRLAIGMLVTISPTMALADVAVSGVKGKVNYFQVHKDPTDASNGGQRLRYTAARHDLWREWLLNGHP